MSHTIHFEVLDAPEAVAQKAAEAIAAEARAAAAARGRFVMAVSGGRTPWLMLRALANMELPWSAVQFVQVDERVAPEGSAERNLTHLRESLLGNAPLAPQQILEMPVEPDNLEAAAMQYAATLRRVAGSLPVLDLVHLGLGTDGHTASLIPGDPVLAIANADVAVTGEYQGRRRMTLTFPIINRSRRILWVVTGAEKSVVLDRLLRGDDAIPAGRISREKALLIADEAAAKKAVEHLAQN